MTGKTKISQRWRRLLCTASCLIMIGGMASAEAFERLGRYETGKYAESAVEMIAVPPGGQTVFVLDASALVVRKLSLASEGGAVTFAPVEMEGFPGDLGEPTAIAASADRLAIAYLSRGGALAVWVGDHSGTEIARVPLEGDYVNALAFSPDGSRLVGLIRGAATVSDATLGEAAVARDDPNGIAFMLADIEAEPVVTRATFEDAALAPERPLRLASGAGTSQAAEPDGIFFGTRSDAAWITLPRNNAVARFDLDTGAIDTIVPLGVKDFEVPGQGADLIADGVAKIEAAPFQGLYMPTGLAVLEDGEGAGMLLISANAGDDRDATAATVAEADLDPALTDRLEEGGYFRVLISTQDGDDDGDGRIETPHVYGGRSIAVWDADGKLIWDSGQMLEERLAAALGPHFNASAYVNSGGDVSSEDFGPQPSDVLVTRSADRRLAIVALKSAGALAVFDIADPRAPDLVEVVPLRDYSVADDELYTAEGLSQAGALGPVRLHEAEVETQEGFQRLLLVASQTSGTIDALGLD